MFGWGLYKKNYIENLRNSDRYWLQRSIALKMELDRARDENKRLFDYHNKKLTKPKLDKNGRLRHPDGKFAKRVR